jgi:hypothetical protein
MPTYTYAPAPVLVESTGEFAINATGVLRATDGGDPVQVFDLNGSPLPSVLVGPKGAHQAFTAELSDGVLDFGSVLLPAISLETQRAALLALERANAALTTAGEAMSIAQAVSGVVFVVHGDDATTPRPTVSRPVIWVGTVEPLNGNAAYQDVWFPVTDTGETGALPVLPSLTTLPSPLLFPSA